MSNEWVIVAQTEGTGQTIYLRCITLGEYAWNTEPNRATRYERLEADRLLMMVGLLYPSATVRRI